MDYADSCASRNCTDRTTNYEDRLGVEYYGAIMLSVIPVPADVGNADIAGAKTCHAGNGRW